MKESIEQVLSVLAEKLGVGVEMIWGSYLKQAPIWALSQIVTFVIIVCLLFVLLYFLSGFVTRGCRDKKTPFFERLYCGGNDIPSLLYCFCLFVIFLISISFMSFIPDLITAFMNPEFWAIEQILYSVKCFR